jgi:type II secretory pathway pseudopilin PulG
MFRTSNTQRGAIGFTITEIMVVTILLGIASAVAIPQFGGNTTQYAQSAATTISQTFQYAQDLAITTQSPVTVSISDSGYVYTLKNSLGAELTHPVDIRIS